MFLKAFLFAVVLSEAIVLSDEEEDGDVELKHLRDPFFRTATLHWIILHTLFADDMVF